MNQDKTSKSKNKTVINLNQARESRLQEKRKNTERVFFNNLLTVYAVLDASRLLPIEILELSEEGCSFQIQNNPHQICPIQNNEIPVRIYFSQKTFLEIYVKIQNSSTYTMSGKKFIRFGCGVEQDLKSYPAYKMFVQFLKLYGEHSRQDSGGTSVFYL